MAKSSAHFRFSLEKALFVGILFFLFFVWTPIGPSNQELLANYAKAKDLADLIWVKKGFAWWTPNYMGGSPTAVQAGSALVYLWLLAAASLS